MVENQFVAKKGAKAIKQWSACSLKAECDKLAPNWLVWGKI